MNQFTNKYESKEVVENNKRFALHNRLKPIFVLFLLCFAFHCKAQNTSSQAKQKVVNKSKTVNSEDKIVELENAKQKALENKDTLSAIRSIWGIAQITSSMGRYAQSYDNYWDALILASECNDSTYTPRIYSGIGVLYSLFGRDKEAESYLNKSIQLIKDKEHRNNKDISMLRNTYYVLASHNRENGDNGIAQKYVDSCKTIHSKHPQITSIYLTKAAQSYIYYNQQHYNKAIELAKSIENELVKIIPPYSVVLYSMMGSMYFSNKEYDHCEYYLQKALEASKKYNSHRNYLPDIYQKLGDLYLKKKEYTKAYSYLQKSKNITEQLFDIRSKENSVILEVKDAFRMEKEKQEKVLKQAKLSELEQKQKILFLRSLTLTLLFISITVISILVIWNIQRRRKIEIENYVRHNKLTEEKNNEIIEIKNKELTSSALQLIQKDELLLEIKNQLEELHSIDKRSINKTLATIKVNKSHDWTEFDARFSSVNKGFYKALKTTYPELTQKDHKLCALIKLEFSSKEISKLLGISMDSVNTARYRLRKKMHLTKEKDLSQAISNLY